MPLWPKPSPERAGAMRCVQDTAQGDRWRYGYCAWCVAILAASFHRAFVIIHRSGGLINFGSGGGQDAIRRGMPRPVSGVRKLACANSAAASCRTPEDPFWSAQACLRQFRGSKLPHSRRPFLGCASLLAPILRQQAAALQKTLFGVRKLACANSAAASCRTPEDLFGVRKLACANSAAASCRTPEAYPMGFF